MYSPVSLLGIAAIRRDVELRYQVAHHRQVEAGQLVVPDKPGLGLPIDQAAVKRYRIG